MEHTEGTLSLFQDPLVSGLYVSMENKAAWHHGGINEENFLIAEKELRQSLK